MNRIKAEQICGEFKNRNRDAGNGLVSTKPGINAAKKGKNAGRARWVDAGIRCVSMKKFWTIVLLTLAIPIFTGCEKPPLKEFEANSEMELAIKNTLIAFRDSANNKNPQGVLDVIHPSAQLMIGRQREFLIKEEYASVLPTRLVENPEFELSVPKLDLSENNAHVRVYMTRGGSTYLFIVDMICEKQNCLINRWEF